MRSIDLQDNLSKAPLASREQAVQQHAAESANQQLTQALNEEHRLDLSRIKPGQEADATENRVDRDGARGRRDRRRRDHATPVVDADDDGPGPPLAAGFSRQIDITA